MGRRRGGAKPGQLALGRRPVRLCRVGLALSRRRELPYLLVQPVREIDPHVKHAGRQGRPGRNLHAAVRMVDRDGVNTNPGTILVPPERTSHVRLVHRFPSIRPPNIGSPRDDYNPVIDVARAIESSNRAALQHLVRHRAEIERLAELWSSLATMTVLAGLPAEFKLALVARARASRRGIAIPSATSAWPAWTRKCSPRR
jgi:hypothetical protein